jgi:Haem-binding uptake, Tiki superfamily, ChaN
VWLGEHHNSQSDHALQAFLIQEIARNRQRHTGATASGAAGMAIGLEQVQGRYQSVLDAYTDGYISMDEMRQRVEWDRRWVWPFENYQSVFVTARELGIPLIALNVDSEDMSAVERQGLAGLPRRKLDRYIPDPSGFAQFAAEKSFRTYVDYVIEPSYELHHAMGLLQYTMTGEKLDKEMSFRDFLSGRLLWDEAMASRAYAWTRDNPNGLLIGLVGAGRCLSPCVLRPGSFFFFPFRFYI